MLRPYASPEALPSPGVRWWNVRFPRFAGLNPAEGAGCGVPDEASSSHTVFLNHISTVPDTFFLLETA